MALIMGMSVLVAAVSVVPLPQTLDMCEGTLLAKGAKITESVDASLAAEGYRLTVGPDGVAIAAADAAGAFYARETLKQLETDGRWPCCRIVDAPAYRWRGVMIDEARHFLGKSAVKRLLDQMAAYKLNVLHWHLTDDQGWRIESKRHPELVEYGSVRPRSVKYGCPTVWKGGRPNWVFDNDRYGPFWYSHEDIREILAYAKARHVTVVPEIELPGHERALLAAHPEFSCKGDLARVPKIGWGIDEEVLCVGNDAALKFLEDVFDEVCELFPDAPYIHIGGDECPRTRWETCPKCQARLKAEKLSGASALQTWMTSRFVRYLERKGRRAVGWDEVLVGDVPRSTVGMSWRNGAKDGAKTSFVSAAEAVRRGFDMVMTPNDRTYLSRPQGFANDPYPHFSPGGPSITLKTAYAFDPMAGLPSEGRAHVLGGQASVWGEYVWNAADLEWKTWPRACAIAEALWTAPKTRDYADFRRRMTRQRERLLADGINCAPLDATEKFLNPLGRPVAIPLANAGFEEGRTGGWAFARNQRVVDRADGRGKCALVEVDDPYKDSVYLTRRVPVEAGRRYAATCQIRTEGVEPAKWRMPSVGACLIVEWCDKNGKWCDAGAYSKSLWGTNGWTAAACPSLKAPADAGFATIYLTLRGKGRAWFDDVTFARLETGTDKLTPAADATVDSNTPKFAWRPVPLARTYRLELSRDPAFPAGEVKAYPAGGFTEYQLEEPLAPGDWYWRVAATGDVDMRPYRFRQVAPVSCDCLAPRVLTRAVRVTDGREPFVLKVRDGGQVRPTVTVLDRDGVCRGKAADGTWEYVFTPPPEGWPKGFVETRVFAVDDAENAAETDFWFLNAPKPANGNRIDKNGDFSENGRRIFPLGIYEVAPKYMKEVRESGFDVVHTYRWEGSQDDAACRTYLDQCWAADGLRAFIGFDRSHYGVVQGNLASVARRVGALADHPGLFCWYLFDEPEIANQFVSPDLLTAFADLVRALDPYHAVVMTTWGKTMNEYRRTWDTHWTQAYDTPSAVVRLLAEHRRLLRNDSPITLLVNCNDSAQGRLWREKGVKPDPAKFCRDYDFLKACAFLGVVKACNGVWWWWFARESREYVSAAQIPSAWANLVKVVKELGELRPLVTAPGKVVTGTAAAGKDKVEWWAKEMPEGLELIAVNTADHSVEVQIAVPGRAAVSHAFRRYETWRVRFPAVSRNAF